MSNNVLSNWGGSSGHQISPESAGGKSEKGFEYGTCCAVIYVPEISSWSWRTRSQRAQSQRKVSVFGEALPTTEGEGLRKVDYNEDRR